MIGFDYSVTAIFVADSQGSPYMCLYTSKCRHILKFRPEVSQKSHSAKSKSSEQKPNIYLIPPTT